jgi:4-amino-4-deoxy-L-arabinose transferase-like glycosyltransferase
MLQRKTFTNTPWPKYRWPMALIGLILLVIGQFLIAKLELPSTPPTHFGQWLNNSLHLGIPSIDNVLNGLPLLLIGGLLLAVALRGLRLLPTEKVLEDKKPYAFRLAAFGWPGILCAFALFGTTLWSLATREYTQWMVIGWLTSLVIVIVVITIWDQRRGINLSPGLGRQDLLWLLGLTILGLVIGVYRLQALPDTLMGDEGYFWTAARDIATGAFKPPIFAVGVYTFPILSSYIQGWVLRIFGISLWGWRFSSVLSGIVTILPLYLLAREAFNRKVAIASSIALIISPYLLAFSRLGYISIQSLFITTLAVYWLYIGLNRDSHLYLFLAGCASGLGFYTFFSARIAFPIGIAFIGFMWLGRKIKFRQAAFAMTLLTFGALLIAGPYLVYGISHDASGMSYKLFESVFFNTFNGEIFYSDKELFAIAPQFTINGNTLFYNPKIYLVLIASGLTRTLLAFQKPGLITEHFISTSLTGTVGALFYLIGLGITIFKFKQPRSLLLLLWFFGVVFGLSTLNTVPPRHTHMVSIIPALAILTGLGLCAIASAISAIHVKLSAYKNGILAFIIIGLSVGGLIDFFIITPDKYHPQPDQIMSWAVLYAQDEAFFYIYSRPEEQEFQPYIASEFRRTVPFKAISAATFNKADLFMSEDKKIIIFYSPDLAESVKPILQAQWGDGYIEKTFYSTGGTPVLAAGMNTSFVFVRDQSLLTILKDSYLRPSFLTLLAVLIGLLTVILILPASWMDPVLKRFKGLTNWLNSPEYLSETKEEQVVFYEEELGLFTAELPSEPPEWADQVFLPDPVKKLERIRAEFKRVNIEDGRDFYFKIHIPPIRILGFRLPERVEFTFPAFNIPNPVLITLAVLLAIVAQVMVFNNNSIAGIVLYLLCFTGLIVWIRINPKWMNVFGNQWRISTLAERLLLGAVLAVTAFIRFYDLNYRVYGLEIDETRWTIQSWYSTILMLVKGDFISQYSSLPLSFWIRSIFLRLFGLNFISGRIESATFSLISIVFLYLLVRRLTASKPIALLSTFLYSFSFFDLNLAHQALGETSSEVWIIFSFSFLILALQGRKWWQFQVTGGLLALGMLTSEMFLPSPVIAIAYITGIGLFEIIKKKSSVRKWIQYLFIVAWPIILIYMNYTHLILNVQRGYDFGILKQFSENVSNTGGLFLFFFRNVSDLFKTIYSHIVWTDPLINWGGSLINPVLLPFILIGFVYNLWNIRRPHFGLIPLWFLFHIGIGPISLGAVYPRALYTVLAPLMIWGAMGLWTFLGALRAWFASRKFKLAFPIFGLIIIAIFFNDYRIFTSSLTDPVDRQKRRELADLTAQSAGKVPMILFPYLPNQDDSLALESNVILFSVAGGAHLGQDAENHFRQLEFSQVLTTLWQDRNLTGLDMFFDRTSNLQGQRNETLNILLGCYPEAVLSKSGEFFDVYHFNEKALNQPKCYQVAPPGIISPQDKASLPAGSPITFSWNTNGVELTSQAITLERRIPGINWIEVEDSFSGPGWDFTSEFVNDFSGRGFLLDEWQAGDALYTFPVPESGQYRIWIKSYKRRVNDQHNFITIDGNIKEFAGDLNPLDKWVWDDLGVYNLSKGQLSMTLSRTYGNDEEYSVFIDVLLITSDKVNPPDQVKVWERVVNTGEVSSTTSEYTLPEILPVGDYRWKVRIFKGSSLVDSSGERGLETPSATFIITP